jgi:hypothetical protein
MGERTYDLYARREILAGSPDSIGERLARLLVDVLERPELHQRLTGVVRAAASEPQGCSANFSRTSSSAPRQSEPQARRPADAPGSPAQCSPGEPPPTTMTS